MSDTIYNFASGPSLLPKEVLRQAQKELLNCNDTGMSVLEMSHRSASFAKIYKQAQENLRTVLNIPEDYDILFLQGGASLQFAMIPMNFLQRTKKADYVLTGHFASRAYEEARRYGNVRVAYSGEKGNYRHIPRQDEIVVDKEASYFHYCANNTVYGTAFHYVPETQNVPLIVDMSSELTSYPIDVSKFTLIYAGAQKNLGPAGLTVVIVKKNYPYTVTPQTPTMLRYQTYVRHQSMYNTPPCFQIYLFSLMMNHILQEGGTKEMDRRRNERAMYLYNTLENTKHFYLYADEASRSKMNVTFTTGNARKDRLFTEEAQKEGLYHLAGHRVIGGLRASMYNAMPIEGVKKLCLFIEEFDRKFSLE